MIKFILVVLFGSLLSSLVISLGIFLGDVIGRQLLWSEVKRILAISLAVGIQFGIFSIIILPLSLAFKAFPKPGDIMGYLPILLISLFVFLGTLSEQIAFREWWWQLHLTLVLLIIFYVLFLSWADKILFERA